MRLITSILTTQLVVATLVFAAPEEAIPNAWTDAETGHRVVRLSRREGSNSAFYFHQNPFTADGRLMVFSGTTDAGRRLFTVDLQTYAIAQVTDRDSKFEVVAPKRREVFYLAGNTVCITHLDSHATREIAEVSTEATSGRGFSVNADETLLAACYAEGEAEFYKRPRSEWFSGIHAAKLSNAIYTVDIASGALEEIHRENSWLGHIQFSPTDPDLLMFCHEGPWEKVDRIWNINVRTKDRRTLHKRAQAGDIAGHEFWGPQGRKVWFDLRAHGRTKFYLASVDLASGDEAHYPFDQNEWSVHYNVSQDGKLFCGDGGDARLNGGADGGKWIYLYRPKGDHVDVERICSMADHDYGLEPNVHFTPDGQWVVFRSNMHGPSQVYAVNVAR